MGLSLVFCKVLGLSLFISGVDFDVVMGELGWGRRFDGFHRGMLSFLSLSCYGIGFLGTEDRYGSPSMVWYCLDDENYMKMVILEWCTPGARLNARMNVPLKLGVYNDAFVIHGGLQADFFYIGQILDIFQSVFWFV